MECASNEPSNYVLIFFSNVLPIRLTFSMCVCVCVGSFLVLTSVSTPFASLANSKENNMRMTEREEATANLFRRKCYQISIRILINIYFSFAPASVYLFESAAGGFSRSATHTQTLANTTTNTTKSIFRFQLVHVHVHVCGCIEIPNSLSPI